MGTTKQERSGDFLRRTFSGEFPETDPALSEPSVPLVGLVDSNGNAVSPGVLGEGDAHVGFVGGHTRVVRPVIAVQASPDYSDGDCVGGLITLTDFARVEAGSGLITRLQLRSLIDIDVQTFVHVFDGDPSASTLTDNGALSVHANDRAKLLKTFTVAAADWADPKGGSPWYTAELIDAVAGQLTHLAYELTSGRDLYLVIEADGTINFSSTADLAALIAAENN